MYSLLEIRARIILNEKYKTKPKKKNQQLLLQVLNINKLFNILIKIQANKIKKKWRTGVCNRLTNVEIVCNPKNETFFFFPLNWMSNEIDQIFNEKLKKKKMKTEQRKEPQKKQFYPSVCYLHFFSQKKKIVPI